MKTFIDDLGHFLEKLDSFRDEFLFLFIKPFWPRKITPNFITSIRILIGIALFILLFFYKHDSKALILSLFCVGVLTDLLDGSIARGLNKVTELGAMLDSTADRLLIIPIAIYSLYQYHEWLLLVLLLIEVLNAVVSIFYKSKEVYLESNIYGKTKMVLQCIVFVVILIIWPANPSQLVTDLLWLTIPFSLLSMITRIVELKSQIKSPTIKKIIDKYENEKQSPNF